MSRNADCTIEWGDGRHYCRLPIGLRAELEAKRGCGIMAIRERLLSKAWYGDDIRETIRLGLIGGGKAPMEALRLVATYCDGLPLIPESWAAAVRIIDAHVMGQEGDEPLGKDKATTDQSIESPSASPSPTATQ